MLFPRSKQFELPATDHKAEKQNNKKRGSCVHLAQPHLALAAVGGHDVAHHRAHLLPWFPFGDGLDSRVEETPDMAVGQK